MKYLISQHNSFQFNVLSDFFFFFSFPISHLSALIRKVLVENASKRYTIPDIQKHQWFKKNFNKQKGELWRTPMTGKSVWLNNCLLRRLSDMQPDIYNSIVWGGGTYLHIIFFCG